MTDIIEAKKFLGKPVEFETAVLETASELQDNPTPDFKALQTRLKVALTLR